jgi:hypothetical protein
MCRNYANEVRQLREQLAKQASETAEGAVSDEQIAEASRRFPINPGTQRKDTLALARAIIALSAAPTPPATTQVPVDANKTGNMSDNAACGSPTLHKAATQVPSPERFCNKCGYFGPDEVHQRPNGSGECHYISTPSRTPAAPPASEMGMTDAQMLDAMQEQRDGAMALMFEERAKAVALREALEAVMEGCEYRTLQGEADWHSIAMPKRTALDKARAALAAQKGQP